MSRFAITCLLLTAACAYGTFLAPQSLATLDTACKAGLGIFGSLSLFALMIGRRIKFDPVLR
ncbi:MULTISPECIES: PA3371 family protein [Stutzerimonas stutzeri subgroup]|jgi:hypothetical protein|uniref:Lipoprotein n=1 Tax=Stutzerimonas stutzeri NF13 TaxID=1212548 RepID=M2VIN4_STUST|nr:PA3371 family protein [Stutzerimonas kunmingensis]EMD99822.1 hypothetical protein B381_12913 [Stutzerimonas stutzeri NF13]MBK3880565.1 hypothetical protein [Stutzerimonas stutzeri]MBS68467.1 hypothetical protein [Pseudomonas sp.]WOF80026.1 PA3371 family protein [Pseudomonas sp. FeN3W]